jgi:general stress protein 26
MEKISIDTLELEKEIITLLEREKYLVLATCTDEHVTARAISHINIGLDIFFQTDKKFLKVKQINQNPRVALCISNLQIEGIAEFQGYPSDEDNIRFCELYKQKHPNSFEMYSGIKDEVIFKVRPSLITLWKYVTGKPCRDYLNITEKIAYREYYKLED